MSEVPLTVAGGGVGEEEDEEGMDDSAPKSAAWGLTKKGLSHVLVLQLQFILPYDEEKTAHMISLRSIKTSKWMELEIPDWLF